VSGDRRTRGDRYEARSSGVFWRLGGAGLGGKGVAFGHHALRREELCALRVKDIHARRGVPHLRVRGKGGKTRYIPLHPGTQGLVTDYLEASGHGSEPDGALYRPVRNNLTGELGEAVTPDGVYKAVRGYAKDMGVEIGAHALRATAATNALDNGADIAKVQEAN
jgi:integrase/recombinase XerD